MELLKPDMLIDHLRADDDQKYKSQDAEDEDEDKEEAESEGGFIFCGSYLVP